MLAKGLMRALYASTKASGQVWCGVILVIVRELGQGAVGQGTVAHVSPHFHLWSSTHPQSTSHHKQGTLTERLAAAGGVKPSLVAAYRSLLQGRWHVWCLLTVDFEKQPGGRVPLE